MWNRRTCANATAGTIKKLPVDPLHKEEPCDGKCLRSHVWSDVHDASLISVPSLPPVSPPICLCLEEWETDRLYSRLIANEKDDNKRESLEHEHMREQQQIQEAWAEFITGTVCAKARRMYLEVPR